MNNKLQENGVYWLCLFGLTTLLCLPVLIVAYPPLVDYPNHLARCFVLHNYTAVPQYVAEYTRVLEPIPNLAMDLIVPPLLAFLPVSLAGRLFLILEIVLFVGGVHALGRAIHGRTTWLTLPLAFVVYNSAFLYGFVNYIFGLGVFALTFALWLQWRAHWTFGRLLIVAGLTLCAFIAHLSAFFFLSLAFGVVALHDALRRTTPFALSIDFLPLLPGIFTFVLYMRHSGRVGDIVWSSGSSKLFRSLSIITNYDDRLIAAVGLGYFVIIAIAVLAADRITLTVPTLMVAVLMIILYLVSPVVLFTSSAADARFVVPAALLLLLSVRVTMPENTARKLLAAAILLGTIRLATIANTWLKLDKRIAAEVATFERIQDGATVYPVFATERRQDKLDRSIEHVICYSVISRHALTPSLFAYATQQPIRFRQPHPFAGLQHRDPTLWLRLARNYDYVWTFGVDSRLNAQMAQDATLISSADRACLWRVEKRVASLPLPNPQKVR